MDFSNLFEQYVRAFEEFDAAAIADCYAIPCSIVDGDGKQVYGERDPLLKKLEKTCLDMKTMGIQAWSFEILDRIELGVSGVAVNIQWTAHMAGKNLVFNSLYVCHLNESNWQIFSANVYSE